MTGPSKKLKQKSHGNFTTLFYFIVLLITLGIGAIFYFSSYIDVFSVQYNDDAPQERKIKKVIPRRVLMNDVEKMAYDEKLKFLAHVATTTATTTITTCSEPCRTATTTLTVASTTKPIIKPPVVSFVEPFWPVESVYPNVGAILPFKRIVAYYGNFYSKGMGVLGEYPEGEMLDKLKKEVAIWEGADPETPVVPAIHYIVVVAQAGAGDGKYRLRMPDDQIEKAVRLAEQVSGIVFLDIQVGLSDLESEIPLFEKYLQLPQVHLAIDPEFSMQTSGKRPGTVIGTFDAIDINYAAEYLAKLVKEKELPPKILMVHRFTEKMVTNYKQVKPLPEVQIVMDMDGWGFPGQKKRTYKDVVYSQPVQFTGLKLFYKNDLFQEPKRMMTPKEILELTPSPSYIQYQ